MGNAHQKSRTKNNTKIYHHVNSPFHPPNPAPSSVIKPSDPVTKPSNPVIKPSDPVMKRQAPVIKPSAPLIGPPSQFMTEEEFLKEWPIWRNQFLMHKTQSNQTSDKHQWGNKLLNLMGPIGQSIFSTFTFESPTERTNVDVLLDKFDEYSVFLTKKRLPLEDVYEYVNDLQAIAKEKNINNVDEIVRKKILKEIDEHQFTNVAKNVIPTFIFKSDFNKLTIKEIAFIWKLCVQTTCKHCGYDHTTDKCPALGKQCLKCLKLDHFQRMCPENFICDCKYCGGYHENKKCPAFNEICTKCKRLHHFSWKCQNSSSQIHQILKCKFCDTSHPASRSVCPARNVICTKCHTKGHITRKCKPASHLNARYNV